MKIALDGEFLGAAVCIFISVPSYDDGHEAPIPGGYRSCG